MPLTNRLDWAVLYRLASSSASLIATFVGTSGQNSISKAPSRRMLRSMAAIRSSRQFSATPAISPSIRGWCCADARDQRLGELAEPRRRGAAAR